ncbi:MAG: alpha/beta hydrolase [Steroidobacteraceae bacterium]
MSAVGTSSVESTPRGDLDEFIARSLAKPGQSRRFEGAGLPLHYLEWDGPTDGKADAPPILLLHGFLAHAHWWDFIAPWLAEHHRVIALDFGGMGDSGHREKYTAEGFVAEIAAVIRHTGLEGCVAVGHSFGGRALLHACHAHPDLVRRALIVDSRLVAPGDPMRAFDQGWRPKKRYASEAEILDRFVLRPDEPCPVSALRHMARASVMREGDAWVWKFDEQITRLFGAGAEGPTDDATALDGLRTPVDLIYGELSRVVNAERADYLLRAAKVSRRPIVLPCGYHHLPVSQPQPLLAALRALLLTP